MFERLSAALSLLFPDVKGLGLVRHPSRVVADVQFADGRTEHAGNLGFGFQKALHLFTVCSLCPDHAILLVDEPEQG